MDVKPFQLNQENMSVLLELHDLLMTWNTDETLVPSSRNTSDNLYKQRFTNISQAKRLCQGLIEEFNKSKDTLIQNFS